jgi:hypothetical protein
MHCMLFNACICLHFACTMNNGLHGFQWIACWTWQYNAFGALHQPCRICCVTFDGTLFTHVQSFLHSMHFLLRCTKFPTFYVHNLLQIWCFKMHAICLRPWSQGGLPHDQVLSHGQLVTYLVLTSHGVLARQVILLWWRLDLQLGWVKGGFMFDFHCSLIWLLR